MFTKKIIDNWFWLALFLVLPLTKVTSFSESFELPKVLMLICVSFMYLGLSRVIVPDISYNVKRNKLLWIMAGYLGWLAIICFLGVNWKNSLFGQYYRYQGLITQISLMVLTIGFSKTNLREKSLVGKIAVTSGIINASLIAKQSLIDGNFRSFANIGNPNFAGSWLAFMAILGLGSIKRSWVKVAYIIILTLAIVATGSRSALISLGAMLMVFSKSRGRWLVAVFLFLVYLAIAVGRPMSHFDQRQAIWQKAIEAVGKRPLTGWGLENFETAFESTLGPKDFDWKNVRVDKAHNEMLEMAVAGGLVGLGLYLGLIGVVGYRLKEDKKMLAIWLGYLIISCLTVVNITSQVMFYLAVGVAAKRWR